MPDKKKVRWAKAEKETELTTKGIKKKRLLPGACEDCFSDKKRDQSKTFTCKKCGKTWQR